MVATVNPQAEAISSGVYIVLELERAHLFPGTTLCEWVD
jgi:membrane-bound ClpP family serine protease